MKKKSLYFSIILLFIFSSCGYQVVDKKKLQTFNILEINKDNFYIVQIAGLIARRIVCNLKINQEVEKGSRIGIIKFGSRVDLYLPENYDILVAKGQKVVGGETIISNPKNIHKINNAKLI